MFTAWYSGATGSKQTANRENNRKKFQFDFRDVIIFTWTLLYFYMILIFPMFSYFASIGFNGVVIRLIISELYNKPTHIKLEKQESVLYTRMPPPPFLTVIFYVQ